MEEEEGSTHLIKDLKSLASGPDKSVTRYTSCSIRGIRFHTRDRDMNRRTQNSGVVVRGEHQGEDIDFYGVVRDIIELSYLGGNRVLLFKCDWWDLSKTKGMQKDEHKFISVNVTNTWYKDEPFSLACQADQVFYLKDVKFGNNWRVVERAQPRGNYDVPMEEAEDDDELGTEEPYQQEEAHEEVYPVEVDDVEAVLRRDDMDMTPVDMNVELSKKKDNNGDDTFINDDSDMEDDIFIDEHVEEYMSSDDDSGNDTLS